MLPPDLTPTRPSSNQRRLTPPAPDAHESPDPQHRHANRHYTECIQYEARPTFTDEQDKPVSLPAHLQTIHDSIQYIPWQKDQACALCSLIYRRHPRRVFMKQRSPASRSTLEKQYYPPHFCLGTCNHVFHSSCLHSWLLESLASVWDVEWSEFRVHGGVQDVSGAMRSGVACEKCDACWRLRYLVARSGVGVLELEELISRIEAERGRGRGKG